MDESLRYPYHTSVKHGMLDGTGIILDDSEEVFDGRRDGYEID